MLNFYLQNELKILVLDFFFLRGHFLMLQDELNVLLEKSFFKCKQIFHLILKVILKLSLAFPFFNSKTTELRLKYPLYVLHLGTLQSAQNTLFDFLLRSNILLFFKYKNTIFILKKNAEKNFFLSLKAWIKAFVDVCFKSLKVFILNIFSLC